MVSLHEVETCNWEELLRLRKSMALDRPKWLFRGQSGRWPLASTLERSCIQTFGSIRDIDLYEAKLIRAFRRRYDGPDRNLVLQDSLYCIALMQHFGAPTRLLDFTYSFFVAALFALEDAFKKDGAEVKTSYVELICLNGDWCWEQAARVEPRLRIRSHLTKDLERNTPLREDASFQEIYLRGPFKRFVTTESPYSLNQRATIQQGAYVCPGDVTVSLEDNLQGLEGWNTQDAVLLICLKLTREERMRVLEELFRMNVTRATLFPGPDGFASSLKQRMAFGPAM